MSPTTQQTATTIFYRNIRWLKFVDRLGKKGAGILEYLGGLGTMVAQTAHAAVTRPFYGSEVIGQMDELGVQALSITGITAVSVGSFLALQAAYSLAALGGKLLTARVVGGCVAAACGPVLRAGLGGARPPDDARPRLCVDLDPRVRFLPDQVLSGAMKAELQLSAGSNPTPLVAGDTIVEFDNVWKAYTRREVLAGVSLKIRKGEVLCVLGPSGTGKSVTIRHINGLEKPDKGDVKVFGESIVHMTEEELSPVRRRVAMLFQGGALFDSMDVEENVGFPLKEHTDKSPREIAELVSEKLLMVGLPGTQRKMPSELS